MSDGRRSRLGIALAVSVALHGLVLAVALLVGADTPRPPAPRQVVLLPLALEVRGGGGGGPLPGPPEPPAGPPAPEPAPAAPPVTPEVTRKPAPKPPPRAKTVARPKQRTPAQRKPAPEPADGPPSAMPDAGMASTGGAGTTGAGAGGGGGGAGTGDGTGGDGSGGARPAHGRNPKPPYPLAARRLGLQGVVTLEVLVRADGRAGDVRVRVSSGHPMLDESAVETVRSRWRFIPARRGGTPIDATVTFPIRFRLDRG